MIEVDFIIVGQGIAGSLLADGLLKRNKKLVVFNHEKMSSASSVAGGMFNPVTGKNLKKTWKVTQLFKALNECYGNLEKESGKKILNQLSIFRPFANLESKRNFISLIEKNDLEDFVSIENDIEKYEEHIKAPFGGLITTQGGWIDVPVLLETLKNKIIHKVNYVHEKFEFDELILIEKGIQYQNFKAQKIIFCEGFYVQNNPFFNWLPFNQVKGETLIGTVENYKIKEIINQGMWLMPMANGQVRVGATYDWDNLNFETTLEAKEQLVSGLEKFLKSKITVQNQLAGVRPATQDRRPIVGKHPEINNVYIFNGLGTKGVSLAPYFVNDFIANLLDKKDICNEINIERFFPLYFKTKL